MGPEMTSLPTILRINAASCIGFGILFAVAPHAVAAFLGTMPAAAIFALGLALIGNGAHLALASARRAIRPVEVVWFSAGDLLWWLATMALLAAGIWITSPAGIAAACVVATGVAGLGLAQLWRLGLSRTGSSSRGHWRRIARSWMAMPLWVKLWLVALNAVFLGALTFVPSTLARVVLIAYVASGPLMLAFAFFQGGLSRIMGIGHLIPWTPLAIWLPLHMASGSMGGGAQVYSAVLILVCTICLAFDACDVWRWMRGERAVIGADMAALPVRSG
jgi:hypothetical protein